MNNIYFKTFAKHKSKMRTNGFVTCCHYLHVTIVSQLQYFLWVILKHRAHIYKAQRD